jgi:3-hydroxyisobutyrate dehydrogenase-like beta-hydroxyacid dehydrogenase
MRWQRCRCRRQGLQQVRHSTSQSTDSSLVLAVNQIALSEGLALGKSLGLDPTLMHNIFNTSSGESPPSAVTLTPPAQSWSSKVNSPLAEVEGSPGSRGYTGGFQTRLMLKVSSLHQCRGGGPS